jgi:dihydroorotase
MAQLKVTRLSAITNARLIDASGERSGTLSIAGDKIGAATIGGETLDAHTKCVAPGIVDLGTFAVDKRACIAGGITR